MKRRLSAGLTLIIGVGCQTTVDPAPTHMLRLNCQVSEEVGGQSRIAVLDIGDAKFDYGLATGHAVPTPRPCVVKDFAGETQSVDMIRLADGYKSGEKTDWAIIRFDKISTKGLVRYELESIEDLRRLEENEFSFAGAIGLQENIQNCKLEFLNFPNGPRRLSHDCRTVPGQSGSPLTRIENGKHRLVGLNIGHLWMFENPNTGRPDRKGYINLLDRETVDEIEAVISANRS